jgi:hypothetical protein
MLDDQTQKEIDQVSKVQISGGRIGCLSPDSSPDVPTATAKHLDLTSMHIAAMQEQSRMKQLTNNRRTHSVHFERQARILESLIVANARLQTEVYKILTVEQSKSLTK